MKFLYEKIRIIPFEASHWQYVYTWANSSDYDYFFGNSGLYDIERCQGFNSKGINFLIVDSSDYSKVLGMISFSSIDDKSRNFRFNILIDKKHRKQGVAKKSSELALFYMFNNENFYKAIALICDGNEESMKLAESFGFEQESLLKQEIYLDGEFKDVYRYRMFKGAFNKRYKE